MNARAIRGAACCAMTVGMLFIGTAGASAAGLTYTVTGFGDGAGSCTATVCTTLRAAVTEAGEAANAGSTISLGAGTYTLTSTLDVDAYAPISGYAMTIAGAGPTQTAIEQTGLDNNVITMNGINDYLLSGLEITGGHIVGTAGAGGTSSGGGALGAGVYGFTAEVDLDDVLITGNTAVGGAGEAESSGQGGAGGDAEGGGYFDESGFTNLITDSTIAGNSITGGSGGHSVTGGTGGVGGAADGGGLYVNEATIVDSAIYGNTAAAGSGGNSSASAGGEGGSADGGGIGGLDTGDLELVNTTVSGNTASEGAAGTGVAPGEAGDSSGGGIGIELDLTLSLFNDTVTGNSVLGTNGYGGNIAAIWSSAGELQESSTVIAAGVGSEDNNCELALNGTTFFDSGYNLEDDKPVGPDDPQCLPGGTVATNISGVSPKLGPLAANGGATETQLPQAGSPLIRAGGACQYENASDSIVPLTTDQRGDPRGSVCDIGAVQLQAAAATGTPTLTGTATVGSTLTCTVPGAIFTGDELTSTHAWLRDGSAIAGATGASYTLTTADAGHQISCTVVATGAAGAAADATSAALAIPTATATATASPTPTAVPTPGTIGLTSKRLSYAHGKVKFELRCTGGQTGCSGRYELYVVKHHGKKTTDVVLAKGTYSLTSGKTKTTNVKPKLSKSESATLRKRHGKLSTVLQLTPTGRKAGKTKTTIEG